jgi:hypothetical protein
MRNFIASQLLIFMILQSFSTSYLRFIWRVTKNLSKRRRRNEDTKKIGFVGCDLWIDGLWRSPGLGCPGEAH